MPPYGAAAEANSSPGFDVWSERVRSVVDNGAMVATGMEDGIEWIASRTFPARKSRQRFAHRLVELGRYRQGFTVGLFFGWLKDAAGDGLRHEGPVSCVGGAVRLHDAQSGQRIDLMVDGMQPRAAARVLRSVASELERVPDTRIDIFVLPDRLRLVVDDEMRLDLRPRHPCPRTAAHLLRHCLGPTASGLRIRTAD